MLRHSYTFPHAPPPKKAPIRISPRLPATPCRRGPSAGSQAGSGAENNGTRLAASYYYYYYFYNSLLFLVRRVEENVVDDPAGGYLSARCNFVGAIEYIYDKLPLFRVFLFLILLL